MYTNFRDKIMIKYLLLIIFLSFFSLPIFANCNGFNAYYGKNKTQICAPGYEKYKPLSKQKEGTCSCWWSGCAAQANTPVSQTTKEYPFCGWEGCASKTTIPCETHEPVGIIGEAEEE